MNYDKQYYDLNTNKIPKEQWIVNPNEKYNLLTVISEPFWLTRKTPTKKGKYQNIQYIECKCECGTIYPCRAYKLKNGYYIGCNKCRPKRQSNKIRKGTLANKIGTKLCYSCQKELTINKFYKNKQTKDKLDGRCKNCAYFSYRNKQYGLSESDVIKQCEICNCELLLPNDSNNRCNTITIDHDHKTGKFRGILCNRCNRTLGAINDSIEILEKMKQYLLSKLSI